MRQLSGQAQFCLADQTKGSLNASNYFSFTPLNYKLGLVRTSLDRAYKINNSWVGFHLDIKLIFLLWKNCFPSWVIDKIIHRYLSKKMNSSLTGQNDSSKSGKTSTHFYQLHYVGRFSSPRLRQLLKCYCKADLDVKLVFSRFKLRNMFSVKDSVHKVYVRMLFIHFCVLAVMPFFTVSRL